MSPATDIPKKRGSYVRINGALLCVTGSRQRAHAAVRLAQSGYLLAPIAVWNGSAWSDTGLVLHATNDTLVNR